MSAPSPLASQALAREVLEQIKVMESVASALDIRCPLDAEAAASRLLFHSQQATRLLAVMNRLRWACNQYANTIQGN